MFEEFRARVIAEILRTTQWPRIAVVRESMDMVAAQMEKEAVLTQTASEPTETTSTLQAIQNALEQDAARLVPVPQVDPEPVTPKSADELPSQADADHDQQAATAGEAPAPEVEEKTSEEPPAAETASEEAGPTSEAQEQP